MLFSSPIFIFVFLPVMLIAFYLAGRFGGIRAGLAVLLLGSLFFYGWWNPLYLIVLGGSVAVNFMTGKKLSIKGKKAEKGRGLLWFGIVFNLALLGYFKYAGFFLENVNRLAEKGWSLDTIVLPLAISFFTFQQIAFLVDSYKGKAKHNSWLDYAVFVTFFPQLIAGPIVHHREMMPQLRRLHMFKLSGQRIAIGVSLFAIGLFKKVVIADSFGFYADPVFASAEAGEALHYTEAWVGALAYTFQIYFDFSGYSDMALGLARMFGVRLPLNFYAPYKSKNIIEFWRRWHMTLSRFLRDYLYFPLGGNRKGEIRRHMNLLITMLLGGLWHGASWNFVIWGGIHGVFLMINHSWKKLGKSLPVAFATGLTFVSVVLTWVFFRAETFDGAMHMFSAMANVTPAGTFDTIWGQDGAFRGRWGVQPGNLGVPFVLLAMIFVWALPNTSQIMRMYRPHIGSMLGHQLTRRKIMFVWSPNFVWGLFIGALMAVSCLIIIYEPSGNFLYFQF